MPQFSLKRLFVSVTLIAAGCGLLVQLFHEIPGSLGWQRFMTTAILVTGGPLVGAGIFNLFYRIRLGALLGLLAAVIWLAILGMIA